MRLFRERLKSSYILDDSESLKLAIYPRALIPGELDRSDSVELFQGVHVPVVSRTDAALSKLVWISKGSSRSRRDFRNIFRNCSQDQQRIVKSTADAMRLSKLIEEVLGEAAEIR